MDTSKVPVVSHISLVHSWPDHTWPQTPCQKLLGVWHPSIRPCLQCIRETPCAVWAPSLHRLALHPLFPLKPVVTLTGTVSHTVCHKTFLSASTCRHLFLRDQKPVHRPAQRRKTMLLSPLLVTSSDHLPTKPPLGLQPSPRLSVT